jgi:hypothetical protein
MTGEPHNRPGAPTARPGGAEWGKGPPRPFESLRVVLSFVEGRATPQGGPADEVPRI